MGSSGAHLSFYATMVLMIIAVLVVLGLALGSFVNALVWRIHEQEAEQGKEKPDKKYLNKLSVARGRSMCPACQHELAGRDLVPLFSWLSLKGRCRYCGRPISAQYPLLELVTAPLFVASYLWWPAAFSAVQTAVFGLWLALLSGLLALLVYDLRWKLLPNRIIYPLGLVAGVMALINILTVSRPLTAMLNLVLAVAVGGGLFYLIFQVSGGKWIGGGDVKLGWLLGLVAGTPARSVLFIFLAALLGSAVSLPLLVSHRLKRTSTIPFGPFLIIGLIIVQLFGASILHWYTRTFITF
jgi:leader peptidase (prepilin peptidase)/N-methyltransferase